MSKHLRPSTVTRKAKDDEAYRTSMTSDLSLLDDPAEIAVIDRLDEKIARTLGIQLPYSEGIQAQRYLHGEEFKKHTDFFAPDTDEYKVHAGKRGQRTWTFMVYLSDVTMGGATRFLSLDRDFRPKLGRALVWNSLYADGTPNYDTMHAGLPVGIGEKNIITKWFRTKGAGPLFYDSRDA